MNLSKGEKVFNVFNIIVLTIISVLTIYPCLHVLFASLSDAGALAQKGGLLLGPVGFTFDAYKEVLKN